jgi:hypothetical protein
MIDANAQREVCRSVRDQWDSLAHIRAVERVRFMMKDGKVVRNDRPNRNRGTQ